MKKAYGDNCIVKLIEDEELENGLVLPTSSKKTLLKGELLDKGNITLDCKFIYFKFDKGTQFEENGFKYRIINKDDILAIE